jgi:type IV secretory pathway VirB2 component (pilin)
VKELKSDLFNTFKSKLPAISYEVLAKGIADALQGMDPRSWLQSIMHSVLGANITFIVCLVIFCIGYSCLQ